MSKRMIRDIANADETYYQFKQPVVTLAGDLSISSSPLGAKIFIDGIDQNTVTPDIISGLPDGTHEIRLTLEGYSDWTTNVSVINGKLVTIYAIMMPDVTKTVISGMLVMGGLMASVIFLSVLLLRKHR